MPFVPSTGTRHHAHSVERVPAEAPSANSRVFKQYVTEVLDSGLSQPSQRVYISHAESFEEPEVLDQYSRKVAAHWQRPSRMRGATRTVAIWAKVPTGVGHPVT